MTQRLLLAEPGLAADQTMALEMSKILLDKYPGYPWAVFVDSRPSVGMAYVENWMVAPKGYGIRIKLAEVTSPETLKRKLVEYGGEMLERFDMRRGKANEADLVNRAAQVWS